jgi:hypothetical protein
MDAITAIIYGSTAAVISGITAYAMTRPEPADKICVRECSRVFNPDMNPYQYMNCVHECLDKKPKQAFLEECDRR